MKFCPHCETSKASIVVNSRMGLLPNSNIQKIIRRRVCQDCSYRWTTCEIDEAELLRLGLPVMAKRGGPKKHPAPDITL